MIDITIFTIIFTILVGMVSMVTYIINNSTHEPMFVRRSVVKYDKTKKVSRTIFNKAINAAILAPNHFLTEPWRFYYCGKETKNKIFKLNESKRKQFESVPEWLVVTMQTKYNLFDKLHQEEVSACACACQNFMLSLASDGVGSKWVTGALGLSPNSILETINANLTERLVGVIWFGYPEKPLNTIKPPTRTLGLKTLKILK